ncbi:MAG: transcriptional repressor [Muribaculaceae bacterium]|nr:transcriptional repressor [Muribaculaceae bacterium]
MKHHHGPHSAEELLEKGGIKPTANRLLVVRELLEASRPLSLIELETMLETMDRSSVSRVLNLLLERDVVHAFEDGRGVSKYEICHGETHCSLADMHAHFYCERCNTVFCFEDISAPSIEIPEEFKIRSVNYMLKGLCPSCARKEQN